MHDDAEIAFYRAVEELFAALRGVHHILSPKDFQLMRSWWSENVPFEAVAAGLTEVFTRRRERMGHECEPVTSLSYCRHAVASHALRIRQARVGNESEGTRSPGVSSHEPVDLSPLIDELSAAERAQHESRPAVAGALRLIRERIAALGESRAPAAEVDEALFTLEAALLSSCLQALDDAERRSLIAQVEAEVASMHLDEVVAERTYRALIDQAVRSLLGLPRLELE